MTALDSSFVLPALAGLASLGLLWHLYTRKPVINTDQVQPKEEKTGSVGKVDRAPGGMQTKLRYFHLIDANNRMAACGIHLPQVLPLFRST